LHVFLFGFVLVFHLDLVGSQAIIVCLLACVPWLNCSWIITYYYVLNYVLLLYVVDLLIIFVDPTCYILSYYLLVDYVLLNYYISCAHMDHTIKSRGVLIVDVSLYLNIKLKIRHIARGSSVYILYRLKHAKLCIVIKHQKGGD
jgi:hypothetical protein